MRVCFLVLCVCLVRLNLRLTACVRDRDMELDVVGLLETDLHVSAFGSRVDREDGGLILLLCSGSCSETVTCELIE